MQRLFVDARQPHLTACCGLYGPAHMLVPCPGRVVCAQIHGQLREDRGAVHLLAPVVGHFVEVEVCARRANQSGKELVLVLAMNGQQWCRRAHSLTQVLLIRRKLGCHLGRELDRRERHPQLLGVDGHCAKSLRGVGVVRGVWPEGKQVHVVVGLH